jgi:hypothetical protein
VTLFTRPLVTEALAAAFLLGALLACKKAGQSSDEGTVATAQQQPSATPIAPLVDPGAVPDAAPGVLAAQQPRTSTTKDGGTSATDGGTARKGLVGDQPNGPADAGTTSGQQPVDAGQKSNPPPPATGSPPPAGSHPKKISKGTLPGH